MSDRRPVPLPRRQEALPTPDAATLRLMADWAMHTDAASPAARQTTAHFLGRYFSTAARNGRREAVGLSLLLIALTLVIIGIAVAVVVA